MTSGIDRSAMLKALEKELKSSGNTLLAIEDAPLEVLPTGFPGLDYDVMRCGGLPMGRIVEIYGKEGCIGGDARIRYIIRAADGRLQNAKGGTLERLYQRFNNLEVCGKGKSLRKNTSGTSYYVTSVKEDGEIYSNKVMNVIDSGVQEVWRVTTERGYAVKATIEHEFLTPDGYIKLGDLKVGNLLMVNPKTSKGNTSIRPRVHRPEWLVKNHPGGIRKIIGGKYVFYRIKVYRAVLEAHMNGLSLEEYRYALNTWPLSTIVQKLVFLPAAASIHHIDYDCTNNALDNLVVLDGVKHSRMHALQEHRPYLNLYARPDTILSIEYVGYERVYDIVCADPDRNFLASNIVVHNCGKSALAQRIISMAQHAYPDRFVGLIDSEATFMRDWMTQNGVDCDMLQYKQTNTQEDAFKLTTNWVETGKFSVVVIDSLANLMPSKMLSNEWYSVNTKTGEVESSFAVGLFSKLTTDFCKKICMPASKHKTLVVIVNQVRADIGGFARPGMPPPLSTPGGHAFGHDLSIKLVLTKVSDIIAPNSKEVIGFTTRAALRKSKVGVSNGTTDDTSHLAFYFEDGIGKTEVYGTLDMAIRKGVIIKGGAWYNWIWEGAKVKSWHGQDKVITELLASPTDVALLKEHVAKSKNDGTFSSGPELSSLQLVEE